MNRRVIISCVLVTVVVMMCGGKKGPEQSENVSQQQTQTPENTPPASNKGTVCILDGVAVREAPNKTGKYLASISLGETVTYLNETQVDAADKNREYLRIRLSDGKEGWAMSYGLIKDAEIGTIKDVVPLYKRPDVLTMTDLRFESMEIVAAGESKDDWVQVIGEGRKKSGWIKKEVITFDREDLATVIFASKMLKGKNGPDRITALKDIIVKAPYPGSSFLTKFKAEVDSATTVQETASREVVVETPTQEGSEEVVPSEGETLSAE